MINADGPVPKISCLMVTAGGRAEMFRRSFDCYVAQTHPNRELLIVNEGPESYQREIAAVVAGRPDVRLVFLDGDYTLGALRNISVRLAVGDLICQWDDDDLNTPDRLSVQSRFLLRHPAAKVCYLSDQLHFYFTTGELYWESWGDYQSGGFKKYGLIPGTLMARRLGFGRLYPSSGRHARAGEDSVLAYEFCDHEDHAVVLLEGAGHLMAYTYHGKNVWDADHHLYISKNRSLPVARMLERRRRVGETCRRLRLGPVRVMGREGLAFVCGGDHDS